MLTDQWLGDAILALARALGDWRGVLALRVVAVSLLVGIVVDTALASPPARPIVAAAAAFPAIALSRFAWTDRPELLGFVCFALLVRLLCGGDRGMLLTIPLLFVWAQLHGSFALGLGLVLASCGARALEERHERWHLAPIAAGAVVATLIGPSGLATWMSSGGHFLAPPRYISEEGVPDIATLPGLIFVVTLALLIATALLSSRRASLREVAFLVPVAFVSLTAARYTPYLAIAAVPFFADRWPDPLARFRKDLDRAATERRLPRGGDALRRAGGIALAGLALAVSVALADGRVDESGYPRAALATVPKGPGLLNLYDWGGWLIYAAPEIPVFIDGRLFPYVPSVLSDYRVIIGAQPGWQDVAARRGVRAILVRPTDPIARRAPESGWRIAYADRIAVVLLR